MALYPKRQRADADADDESARRSLKNLLEPDTIIIKKLKTLAKATKSSKPQTLSDLNLSSNYLEVTELTSSEVQMKIKTLASSLAKSIVDGNGFSFTVPARATTNQVDRTDLMRLTFELGSRKLVQLARILSIILDISIKNTYITKEELFSLDNGLFKHQTRSDAILDNISCMLGCTRSSLNIVDNELGMVVGHLKFTKHDHIIDCTKMGDTGTIIPRNIHGIDNMSSDALFILLVEKDEVYTSLAMNRFYDRFPCIILTGNGKPGAGTRSFLSKLKKEFRLPVLALSDSDPYNLKILSEYGSGSKNEPYISASLITPGIKWLGVRPTDWDKYKIPENCRLPMTEQEIKTCKDLLKDEFVKKNPGWVKELEIMVKSKQKVEIEALCACGIQYMYEVFLPLKLQEQDWI